MAAAHYAQYYMLDYFRPWFVTVAQGFLAFFFLLSGLGIFLSLEKRFNEGGSTLRIISRFYLDRAVRIYPLYWLALFLIPFVIPYGYEELHIFKPATIAIYLLLPVVRATNLYWFMTLIVQCYILAPFLYLIVRKMKTKKCILFNFILTSILFVISLLMASTTSELIRVYFYKGFFLGHVLIFSYGMLMPLLFREHAARFSSRIALLISGLIFLLLHFETSTFEAVTEIKRVYIAPIYFLDVLVFCLFLFGTNPVLPLRKVFIIPGKYSYTVYLYHLIFFGFIAYLGLVTGNVLINIIIVLMLMPVFLAGCALLENGYNSFAGRILK